MSSFADIFDATIGSIIKNKHNLIEVISTTPLHEVINIFKNNEITSIPIFENISENQQQQQGEEDNKNITQGKKYIGIISMVDILSFILKIGDDDTNDSLSHQVKYVLGSTQESLNINLSIESEDTPLSIIVEKMSQGLHRCLVYSGPNSPMKLLTQTDVVQCILSNANSFPPIQNALSIKIEAIKGVYDLVAISENNLLISALDELRVHSAVAIVNDWGEIVSNLSATDFHSILTNFTFFTNITIKQYFTHRNLISAMTGKYLSEPVTVTSSDTLHHASFLMLQYHIHRVWIVEDGFIGKGCISLTDVIKAIYTLSGSDSS